MQKRCNIEAKSLFYTSDGSGRDTYIGVNSGGICKQRPYTTYTTERKDLIFRDFSKHVQVNIIPKTVHYNSDGSGRDKYININEGGLTMNGKSQFGFINDLRSYKTLKKHPMHMEKDYLNDGQKLLPKIEMDKLKKTQRSQKYSSYRLAQPRIYPDPYEGVFYRPKTPSMIRTESQNKSFNYY